MCVYSHFHFQDSKGQPWVLCGISVAVALIARVTYLFLTTAIYGDATHYASIGQALAAHKPASVDPFWVSLFTLWEGVVFLLVNNAVLGAILATLIPGVLLMIPLFWLGKLLFNETIGFYAALVTALHPRMIAFSCNGYSEVFYILFASIGVMCLTLLLKNRSHHSYLPLIFGFSFACYFLVRNEGILLFLVLLPTFWFLPRKVSLFCQAILSFLITVALYIWLCEALFGQMGIGQKSTNLTKHYSEQLEIRLSAKETYGKQGLIYDPKSINPLNSLLILIHRLPSNLFYMFKTLPGVLLTPLIFTAILLPVVWRPEKLRKLLFFPSLCMLAFPLLFYPFMLVEPRHFLMSLIPLHIFGCAGLYVLLTHLSPNHGLWLFRGVMIAIAFWLIPVTVWYGRRLEARQWIHHQLAGWLKTHVPAREIIAGDGFGYISTTTFLSGHPSLPRLWTDQPNTLRDFLKEKNVHFLIVYEPFLSLANPELLTLLDRGIEGMHKVYEIKDQNGMRYQIYSFLERTE